MDINIGKISSKKPKEEIKEVKKDSNVKQIIINNGNVKEQVFIKEVKDLKL